MASPYWIGGSGSQSWTTGANWSGGSIPAAGDSVYILTGSSDIDTGLSQSTVGLALLTVGSGFTGTIGAANETGAFLAIGITTLRCTRMFSGDQFLSGGPTRFKWDSGTNSYTAIIDSLGAAQDTGFGCLRIKGGSTTSKLYVNGGTVDVATRPGDTATLNQAVITNGTLVIDSGTTLSGSSPSVRQTGGTLLVNASVATFIQQTGTAYIGAGSLAAATVNGTCNFNNRGSSPDIGTLTIQASGVADFNGDPRTTALTNTIVMYGGATLKAFNKSQIQVGTNGTVYQVVGAGLETITVNFGNDITDTLT